MVDGFGRQLQRGLRDPAGSNWYGEPLRGTFYKSANTGFLSDFLEFFLPAFICFYCFLRRQMGKKNARWIALSAIYINSAAAPDNSLFIILKE
ncbi:hypothetical protein EJD96_14045 [Herbaspirillum seropedicae]|uniref:hypothetical protein n=1 Tax=Herbaspirillum seropedicae TaxID=964 RepID=UPI00111DD4FC|nr:hypothetical protein [Herbaspirillum seropedicae]QDD65203.1 hypothetical protein EJD96_14045 [Herbaspirillum seropedicae]